MMVERQSRAAKKGRQVGQAVAERQGANQQSDKKAAVANAPADNDLHADRIDAGKQRARWRTVPRWPDRRRAARRAASRWRVLREARRWRTPGAGRSGRQCRRSRKSVRLLRSRPARRSTAGPAGRARSRPREPCRAGRPPRRTTGSSPLSRPAPGGRRTFSWIVHSWHCTLRTGPPRKTAPARQLHGNRQAASRRAVGLCRNFSASRARNGMPGPAAPAGCDHRGCLAGLLHRASPSDLAFSCISFRLPCVARFSW